ncbi:hypothetical protein, partial [Mycoplasma tauri]|uniref:hypothetical protein n=1 Tax=Mycoplasma tauri TaxID=547987 RepID=UPI004037D310|nr:hypothetical protein [Mycoplasma tauri]
CFKTLNQYEQQKISSLFLNLNTSITLHQRKLEKLKNIKNMLLEKMFADEKTLKPAIRFKEFTNAWEQRRLGEIATLKRGLTYKPSDCVKNGIRILRSSNIHKDKFILFDNDIFVNKKAINIDFAKTGDILITASSGSVDIVGKHTIIENIPEKTAVHGGFMLLCKTKYPNFLNESMNMNWYKRLIMSNISITSGSINNLKASDIEFAILPIPNNPEISRISNCFKFFNSLITLHQRNVFLFIFSLFYIKKVSINMGVERKNEKIRNTFI